MSELDKRTNLLVGMAVLAGYTFELVYDFVEREVKLYRVRKPNGHLIPTTIYAQFLPDAARTALQDAGITEYPPTEELKDDSN